VLPLLLAGCDAAWPSGSYVSVNARDAARLAPAVADYLASALPSHATVALAPAQPGDPMTPVLAEALSHDGITPAPTGRPVQYVVTPLDDGVLLHIALDGGSTAASRYFVRSPDGSLTAAGPMMERTR